jgi:heptosyltransferase-2
MRDAPGKHPSKPVIRILVVAPNWIGDAIMSQPLLARLRARHPDARIDVLAPEWVAPVYRRMPEAGEVIGTRLGHGALQLGERWRLGRMLKARAYDQAIVLPNSWKSALVPFFAGIASRSGYVGESRYGLLNRRYRRAGDETRREPMAVHYARLAEPPDAPLAEPLPEPRLRVDTASARSTAARFGFAAGANAVLCPGAEYGPAKRWPAERFGALAGALAARGQRVWLLGSAGDAAACEEVVRAARAPLAGAVTSLAGRTTLDEAIDLIACSDFVVTNDSGLMHIAAALERPLVALFGSSSPKHTPPLSATARVVWLGLECSPCFARVCPLGHFRCMREIAPERVLMELESLRTEPTTP